MENAEREQLLQRTRQLLDRKLDKARARQAQDDDEITQLLLLLG
jgi:type II secretory pathway component PulJ